MSPSKARPSANPKSLPPMFANRFLRTLAAKRFTKRRATLLARARRIRRAAEISLASAAASCNPRSTWSRAVLRRRRTGKNIRFQKKGHTAAILEESGENRIDLLRRLVPGGSGLDFCRLLEETVDYIKSLNVQVQEEIAEITSYNIYHGK